MTRKKIAVLGSTGSIGEKTVRTLKELSNIYEVISLTAHSNVGLLVSQAEQLRPKFIGISGEDFSDTTVDSLPKGVRYSFGSQALIEACEGADVVVLAVVGIAGLPAFEYCLKNGITVALATKEAMVCGGRLARDLMDSNDTLVLPIDSEMSAIFQCLEGNRKKDVRQVWLTASGGPFLNSTKEEIAAATPECALRHPNWNMGAKISIDSATLMNKGLEIMETRWMFDIPSSKIKVVIHPQSLIHSLVEYVDGSLISQMATADMQLAIHYALTYPRRLPSSVKPLDLYSVTELNFLPPDTERFPCLELAYEAAKSDGSLQLVVNSSNEVAVELFLNRAVPFTGIPKIIESAMTRFQNATVGSFDDIYSLDSDVRRFVYKTYKNSI